MQEPVCETNSMKFCDASEQLADCCRTPVACSVSVDPPLFRAPPNQHTVSNEAWNESSFLLQGILPPLPMYKASFQYPEASFPRPSRKVMRRQPWQFLNGDKLFVNWKRSLPFWWTVANSWIEPTCANQRQWSPSNLTLALKLLSQAEMHSGNLQYLLIQTLFSLKKQRNSMKLYKSPH